jgi:hypothetical protein
MDDPKKSMYQIIMELLLDRAAKRIANRESCLHLLNAMASLEKHRGEEPPDGFDKP